MYVIRNCNKIYQIATRSVPLTFKSIKYKCCTNIAPSHGLQLKLHIGFSITWPLKMNIDNDNDIKTETLSILKTADNLFENGHYDECYKLLKNESLGPSDVEVRWRICRILYNMTKESNCDEITKKKLTNEAFRTISELLETNPNHFAVHKWYAILLDSKSSYDGIKKRIEQLDNVKKHMDIAINMNPTDATTLHMLGEWCFQIAEMPWYQRKIAETFFASPPYATYEDALEYFLKAEQVQPRFYSINLLRLGACYMKLKKEDQAKYYLKLAASYPAKTNDDHQANKEASELLSKLLNLNT